MHCRNCRCYLDNECRYCPRCGTPISLWPAAGAPWLRRPAAIAGLAFLLIVWLAALQRQLWLSTHRPPGRPPPSIQPETIASRPTARGPAAEEPLEAGTTLADRLRTDRSSRPALRRRPWAGGRRSGNGWAWANSELSAPEGRSVPAGRQLASAPVPRRLTPTPRQVPVVGAPERPQSEKTYVYLNGGRLLGTAPLPIQFESPGQYRLLFWTPTRRRREMRVVEIASRGRQWIDTSAGRPLAVTREPTATRRRPEQRKEDRDTIIARTNQPTSNPARPNKPSPWSRPPVPAKYQMAAASEGAVHPSDLVVNVSARPYGVKTFVYLNGGRLLGTAPLPVQFDRPGRYRLLFWSPSLRSQVARTVEVTGRRRQWVSATMGQSRYMARGD